MPTPGNVHGWTCPEDKSTGATLANARKLTKRKLGEKRCGRATLLAGTVVRDATLRFCLGNSCPSTGNRRRNRSRSFSGQQVGVHGRNDAWIVRALIGRRAYPDSLLNELAAFLHLHHAVMPSIPSATGRQPGIRGLSGREQRGDNRKAKDGQQQDGDESAQQVTPK